MQKGMDQQPETPLKIALVAGEHSGDALGAKLMVALKRARPQRIDFSGLGGEGMVQEGMAPLFPLSDVAVMGPLPILASLPRLLNRAFRVIDTVVAAEPDVLVIIDSPEFTHPIARRVRKRRPAMPIIDYVSPSVWAWRPGRARRMRPYVDHVLALLPFEPDTHARLGGPLCSYVGHPLIERLEWITAQDGAELARRLSLRPGLPVVVVLPGSRRTEVGRLMPCFAEAMAGLSRRLGGDFEVLMPVAPAMRPMIEDHLSDWVVQPHLIESDADKFAAFRLARVALAASGTVALELALAGTPMVIAYRVDPLAAPILRRAIKARSVVLPNMILDENAFPEFLQVADMGEKLAECLAELMGDTPARAAQLQALAEIPARLRLAAGTPSEAAAAIVLDYAEGRRKANTNG